MSIRNPILVFDAIVFRALMHCIVCRDYTWPSPLYTACHYIGPHFAHYKSWPSQMHYNNQCDEIKTLVNVKSEAKICLNYTGSTVRADSQWWAKYVLKVFSKYKIKVLKILFENTFVPSSLILDFLLRDAMGKRGNSRRPVSVCLSCHTHCIVSTRLKISSNIFLAW